MCVPGVSVYVSFFYAYLTIFSVLQVRRRLQSYGQGIIGCDFAGCGPLHGLRRWTEFTWFCVCPTGHSSYSPCTTVTHSFNLFFQCLWVDASYFLKRLVYIIGLYAHIYRNFTWFVSSWVFFVSSSGWPIANRKSWVSTPCSYYIIRHRLFQWACFWWFLSALFCLDLTRCRVQNLCLNSFGICIRFRGFWFHAY